LVFATDHYAGAWPREAFARHGILYLPSPKVRSDLYLSFLSLLLSQRVDLLDHPKTLLQFQTLVREVGKSGKDKVNHAVGAHNDCANAVAGVVVLASKEPPPMHHAPPIVIERERGVAANYTDIPASEYENPAAPSRPEYQAAGDANWLQCMGYAARLMKGK
jgi:hypothetical protein